MILKERGLLNYDDNVKKYLPELPYEGMTIRHFLTHTSGIPDYMEEFNKGWDPKKIAFNDDMIKLLVKNKPCRSFQTRRKMGIQQYSLCFISQYYRANLKKKLWRIPGRKYFQSSPPETNKSLQYAAIIKRNYSKLCLRLRVFG